MECQKTFNAPNKNLDKTDSGASLSVRLKFKEKKNVTSYNESIHRKNKGSGKDRIHSDESNVTCSQNKAKPLASIYIAFYLNMY